MKHLITALILAATGASANDVDREYGSVWLTGMARDSWHLNNFATEAAMVCNVNGPDGFLSVRSGPGTDYEVRRSLKRLAILELDMTRPRQGHWVYVKTAYRTHSTDGDRLADTRSLHVSGWAHDGYMCDFID